MQNLDKKRKPKNHQEEQLTPLDRNKIKDSDHLSLMALGPFYTYIGTNCPEGTLIQDKQSGLLSL